MLVDESAAGRADVGLEGVRLKVGAGGLAGQVNLAQKFQVGNGHSCKRPIDPRQTARLIIDDK